jgi:DUF971 family protein
MDIYPTALKRLPDGRLRIDWSDDRARTYTIEELRSACPCATCRESPPELTFPKPEEGPALTVSGMTPVGNYAYCIAFSDGHDTGIYTYEFLQKLGEPITAPT